MNEDRKDADDAMVGMPGGIEEHHVVAEPVEYLPDPPAVASMRAVIDKLKDQEETRATVEVTASTMERMADGTCDLKHWKKIRWEMLLVEMTLCWYSFWFVSLHFSCSVLFISGISCLVRNPRLRDFGMNEATSCG